MLIDTEDLELTKSLIEHALQDDRGQRRFHITRLRMYLELENLLKELDGPQIECLGISGSQVLTDVVGMSQAKRTVTSFPDVNMLAMPFEDNKFDVVISDQVLEHIEGDPFQAVGESVRVAKPGAWIIHTTCFINFMHQLPLDFWRFTPQSLEILIKRTGATVVKKGGWGNRAAWSYMSLGYRKRKVPEVPGNPIYQLAIKNERKWPVVTWIVARKPEKNGSS